jgi:hypothetical protein
MAMAMRCDFSLQAPEVIEQINVDGCANVAHGYDKLNKKRQPRAGVSAAAPELSPSAGVSHVLLLAAPGQALLFGGISPCSAKNSASLTSPDSD